MNQRPPASSLLVRLSILGLIGAFAAPSFALQGAPPPPGDPPTERGQRGDGQRRGGDEGRREGEGGRRDGGRFGGGFGRGPGLIRRFADSFRPDYLRRDLPLIREQLKLDEAQALLVETLLSDYEEAFMPASEQAQTQLEEQGRAIAQSFMNEGVRDRMRQAQSQLQADLEQIAAESGGEIDPEVRSRLIRERMSKVMEEMRQERDKTGATAEMQATMAGMIDIVEKWKGKRTQLRDEFVNGLKSTLTPDQSSGWLAFERFMRRERALPQGTLSGESVNLFAIVDDAELSKETMASITPILDRYEIELDEALKARDSFLDQSEIKFLRAAQSSNQREVDETARRASELHKVVRDVNDRYRVEVVAALPEDQRGTIERAALVAGYDRVYRPTQAERSFDVALALEDLAPEMKPPIEALQTQFSSEVATLNERIMTQVQKQEPQDVIEDAGRLMSILNGMPPMGGFGGRGFGGRGGGEQAGPLQDLYSKRGDLSDAYMRRLRDLLTAEQREKLPQRGGGRGGQFAGGFGGGGGGALGSGRIADMPGPIQDRVREYDTNKDGIIDETERRAVMEALRRDFGPGGGAGGPGGGGGGGGGERGNRNNAS
ncbi:MAG: hypothetical protein FJ253_04890 [Phycisphaerae bacterium]|nr:hypothetical protein [Phycisphaerae bacterium]